MQTTQDFAGSTDMWSTSAGGHLMKVVNLTGFTVSTSICLCHMPGSLKQTTQTPDSSKPTKLKEKHPISQNLHQDTSSVVPTHQHRRSNQELHSFFPYFGSDSNFHIRYKHYYLHVQKTCYQRDLIEHDEYLLPLNKSHLCVSVCFALVICNLAYDLKMAKHGQNMSSLSTQ